MRTESVQYFTEKEEEFANLLEEIGMKRTVAKVLVFLANVNETTSRGIERGTDLRQPEVSIGVHDLINRGWVTFRETKADGKGRPIKIYNLAKSMDEIVSIIETEKKEQTSIRLSVIKKMREHV
jgi:predicted transcriptional regulator